MTCITTVLLFVCCVYYVCVYICIFIYIYIFNMELLIRGRHVRNMTFNISVQISQVRSNVNILDLSTAFKNITSPPHIKLYPGIKGL